MHFFIDRKLQKLPVYEKTAALKNETETRYCDISNNKNISYIFLL